MTLMAWVRPPAAAKVRPIERGNIGRGNLGQWSSLAALTVGLLGAGAWAAATPQAVQANEPAMQTAVSYLLFVHPVLGNDATGDGSPRSPFRTITRAAQSAPPNAIILLAAGNYAAANGEQFPILLPPGVSVQADPTTGGEGVVIQGQITQSGANSTAAIAAPTARPAARPAAPQSSISAEVMDEPAVPFPFAAAGAEFLPTVPTGDFPASTGLNSRREAAPRTFGRAAGRRSPAPASASASVSVSAVPANPLPPQVAPPTLQGIPISVTPPVGAYPPQPDAAGRALPSQPISTGAYAPAAAPARRPVEQRTYRRLPGRTSQGGAVALSPSRQEPVASFQGAIEIPVPPPERSGSRASRSATSPVQRYERPPAVGRSPVAAQPASQYSQYTLLPVPDPNAPIGNVSGVPSVPISGDRPRPTTPVASRASELGLRYRVVVSAADAAVQDRVLSVFPGAFLTYDRRQSVVMQVGAFNSEANAQDVIDILRQNGVRAQIERVD